MYPSVLTKNPKALLPLIKKEFGEDYYLAGETAIALQIGHRRSIDCDLFTIEKIKHQAINAVFHQSQFPIKKILYEAYDQMHVLVNGVKITFFTYPYPIVAGTKFQNSINMPNLLDLAAMKAYALGGRGKWKDYVDLYFILRFYFPLSQIENRIREVFGELFNRKLFREQLAYYDDIDDSEEIDFIGEEVAKQVVKEFLTNVATTPF